MENKDEIKERIELIKDMTKVKQRYEEERDLHASMNIKYFKVNKKEFYDLFHGHLQMKHDEDELKKTFNSFIQTCEVVGETTENYVFSYDGSVRGFEKLIQYQKEKIKMLLS